jgi:uncharacterized repeat protein (TIGR01451 family)
MTNYTRIGAILFIAMALWGGAVSAAHAQANLELTKTLLSKEPLFAGDQALWKITLTNSGDAPATDIEVTEIPGDFLTLVNAVPSTGTNLAGTSWSIPELAADQFATLSLETTVTEDAAVGELQNCAEITSSTPAQDTEPVCASGETSPTVKLDVTIKPETLNLKSRGVFTVFIRFSEETTDFDFGDLSSLECNGAKPTKLHITQKDGGTLMAKYRRQDLVDVVAGDQVPITCEVTISTDGGDVKFAGTDTLRVIGEKKKGLDAFFAGILDTVLPVEDDEEEVAGDQTTTTVQPTATPSLNRGQLKKAEQNTDGSCTENCNAAGSQDNRGNGKKSGADDQTSVTGSSDKGNQGKGNDNSADKGNGKGNSNKPDNEKGNGNNKK